MGHFRSPAALACVALLLAACLERVDGADVRCTLDRDCPDGIACGPEGFCVPGQARDPLMNCSASDDGGPFCVCPEDYQERGAYDCERVGICQRTATIGVCPSHSACVGTGEETYECRCDEGFTAGEGGGCVDVDECLADPTRCEALGALNTCENTVGGFFCGCAVGARLVDGVCVDVDECTEGTHTCTAPATCVNDSPGHDCACPEGYDPDGEGGCTDIDECLDADACPRFETCANNPGAAPTCTCESPYTRASGGTCVTSWEKVSAGTDHTCAIRTDGRLFCWGDNRKAQLGFGADTPPTVNAPAPVLETWSVREVATGNGNTCVIRTNGELWCWGANLDGQLGINRRGAVEPQPTRVGTEVGWTRVSLGPRTACGLRDAGGASSQAYCWGSDDSGQLGLGRPQGSGQVLVPTRVTALDGAREIVVAASHVVALTETRGLACWGSNSSGQCGRDPATTTHLRAVTTVPGITNVKGIGAGNAMTCFSVSTGGPSTLQCMGAGPLGNVASGWRGSSFTPVRVGLAGEWSDSFSISHYNSVLALRPEGALFGWGEALEAQLGEHVEAQGRPVAIAPGREFFVISAGSRHGCAIDGDGVLSCWGANGAGQLGRGEGGDAASPQLVAATGPFDELWSTDSAFSLCANVGGEAQCWGATEDAGLVAPINSGPRAVPTPRHPTTRFRELSSGATAVCGIDDGGALLCWGSAGTGLTWPRNTTDNGTIRVIDAGTAWKRVRVGFDHACALKSDGSLWCWGEDSPDGQLATGRDTTGPTTSRPDPVAVATDLRFDTAPGRLSVRAGGGCAIEASPVAGRLRCWGANDFGQLGVGGTSDSGSPLIVGAGNDWSWVAAGTSHTCGVRGGKLYCWGYCDNGACGEAAAALGVATTPQWVADSISRVTVGTSFSCALGSDGTASCFGLGDEGQLGGGRFGPSVSAPQSVTAAGLGGTRWVSLAAIDATVCGSRDDGRLYCWGDDSGGALGRGLGWIRPLTRVADP